MLAFLYTESKTPIVHVRTLWADAPRLFAGVSDAALANMTAQERADVRLKTAQRLNLELVLEWSPYFSSAQEDRRGVPGWAAYGEIMQACCCWPFLVVVCYQQLVCVRFSCVI